jgi:hypothetical protein
MNAKRRFLGEGVPRPGAGLATFCDRRQRCRRDRPAGSVPLHVEAAILAAGDDGFQPSVIRLSKNLESSASSEIVCDWRQGCRRDWPAGSVPLHVEAAILAASDDGFQPSVRGAFPVRPGNRSVAPMNRDCGFEHRPWASCCWSGGETPPELAGGTPALQGRADAHPSVSRSAVNSCASRPSALLSRISGGLPNL